MRKHWWLPRELSCFNGRNHLKVRGEPAAKQFITVRRLEIYALPASSGNPEQQTSHRRTDRPRPKPSRNEQGQQAFM